MKKTAMIGTGRVLLAGVLLGILAAGMSGCNTVKGAGEDITRIGEGGQKIIDDAGK